MLTPQREETRAPARRGKAVRDALRPRTAAVGATTRSVADGLPTEDRGNEGGGRQAGGEREVSKKSLLKSGLRQKYRRRLSDEERQLADLGGQGDDWAEIAAAVGGTPQARRKQLARAVERVGQQLEGVAAGAG